MHENRTKNASFNMIAGLLNKFVVGLFPFVTRTAILYTLGEQYLGLNGLFSSIITVLSLADMGIYEAIVYTLYEPIAKGDHNKIASVMDFSSKIYSRIGGIILLLGLAIMPVLPHLITGGYPVNINLYFTYFIFLLNTTFSYWFFAYKHTILIAYQQYRIISFVNTITIVAQNLIQIIFILITKNYYWYLMPLPFLTITNNLILNTIVNKKIPLKKSEDILGQEEKSKIYSLVSGLTVGRLADTFRNAADSIILSALMGLIISARYGNYYTVFSALYGLFLVGGHSMQSGIGSSIVTEPKGKNYFDFRKLTFLFACATTVVCACLVACYQPFISIWAGENAVLSNLNMILFCIYFYILTNAIVVNLYGNGLGLWKKTKKYYIMEAAGNIFLNIILGYWMGVSGILLATILTTLFLNLVGRNRVIFDQYFTDFSFTGYLKLSVKYAFVTTIVCGVIFYTCSFISINSMRITLLIDLIIAVVLSLISLIFAYHHTEEFLWAKNMICDYIKNYRSK